MIEETKKEILDEIKNLVVHILFTLGHVILGCICMYIQHYFIGIMSGGLAILNVKLIDLIIDSIKLDIDLLELKARGDELNEMKKKFGIT